MLVEALTVQGDRLPTFDLVTRSSRRLASPFRASPSEVDQARALLKEASRALDFNL